MTTIRKMTEIDFEDIFNRIDLSDADSELPMLVREKDETLLMIEEHNEFIGLAQFEPGCHSYIYIFIDPSHRRKGYGQSALKLVEAMLTDETEKVGTNYRMDNKAAKLFANKNGYNRLFNSYYMQYSGELFDVSHENIRPYKDEDFKAAHGLFAVAFHEMRVHVGDFPDSKVAPSNEQTREAWEKSADHREVYVKDGQVVACSHIVGNEISSISVKSECQGQGIGKAFVKYATNKILEAGHKTSDLYCVKGNLAKHLYDQLGYKEVYLAEFSMKPYKKE